MFLIILHKKMSVIIVPNLKCNKKWNSLKNNYNKKKNGINYEIKRQITRNNKKIILLMIIEKISRLDLLNKTKIS